MAIVGRVRVRNSAEISRKIEALARAAGDPNVSGMRVIDV